MNLHYSTEPLVCTECASILTKFFYSQKHPDDPEADYDIDRYFEDYAQRNHVPKERLSRFSEPLSVLYRDIAQAAEQIPQDAAELFFAVSSPTVSSVGTSLSLILEQEYRLRDIGDESRRSLLRFHIGLTMLNDTALQIDDGETDFGEASFIRYLEKSADSPEMRWKALMVWRHTDEYLDRLEDVLRAPAEAYRKNLPALKPLFDETIGLVRAQLAENPRRAIEKLYYIRLDIDELTIRPQSAILSGASLWILSDVLEKRMMLIGCCFEQLRTMAIGSEEQTAGLARQLKALEDKQRLKILSALKEKPLCGQEICALTGLSPATVSHHMNSLINGSFLTIEKAGTRINYRQSPDKIRLFLKGLSDYLLD